MASKNRTVRFQSLGTLIDEMIDPEKCCRAFGQLAIVKQLTKVLQLEIATDDDDYDVGSIYQRPLIVLQTIAGHEVGAEKILAETNLINVMNYLVGERIFSEEVAKIWSEMASNYYSMNWN